MCSNCSYYSIDYRCCSFLNFGQLMQFFFFNEQKIEDVVQPDVLKLKERQIAELKRENKSLDKKYKGLKEDFKQLNSKYEDLHSGHLKLVQDVSNDIKEIKGTYRCESSWKFFRPKIIRKLLAM